jgi:hypothetical protein
LTISETTRREMHARLVDVLGTEAADTLMEYLPPVGWADVATKRDLDAHQAMTKRDLDALRLEFTSAFDRFDARFTDKLNQQTRTLLVGSAAMMAATVSAVSALVSVSH